MLINEQLEKQLEQYAALIVERGVAISSNQLLVVTTSASTMYFVPYVVKAAYAAGAGDVQIRLEDDEINAFRNQNAEQAQLEQHYKEQQRLQEWYTEREACFVRLVAPQIESDFQLTEERKRLINTIRSELPRPSLAAQFAFVVRRQASPVATVEWAEQIFPRLKGYEAFHALWEVILSITYSNQEDAISAWDAHITELLAQKAKLNELDIAALHFTNSLGTDITIELASNQQWFGGNCYDVHGHEFYPSIPTEEIFAAPHRDKVNGIVYNSIPLYVNNTCIDQFRLTFQDGVVTHVEAKVGEELLREILNSDEGARRLGEVALVHKHSPLAKSNLLFYETLLDENRTSHIALGAGYPGCIVGEDRSVAYMESCGLNQSSIHIDFMFGTDDMLVTAVLRDGKTKIIMKNGEFV